MAVPDSRDRLPVLVAASRMYRGEHHPTDVAGSFLLAAIWLTATTVAIKPAVKKAIGTGGRGRQMPG